MSDQTAPSHGDVDQQRNRQSSVGDSGRAASGQDGANDRSTKNDNGSKNDKDSSNGNSKDEKDGKDGKDANGSGKNKSKKPLISLAVVAVILLIGAFIWWFATRNQVTTADAYTDGNAITIAPQVSGYVVQLAINDNVYVHKGELLVVIDKREYQAQVDAAQAQLGLAQAQLNAAQVQLDIARVQYPAQYLQAKAQTSSAEANLKQAQAAYVRQHAVDVESAMQPHPYTGLQRRHDVEQSEDVRRRGGDLSI